MSKSWRATDSFATTGIPLLTILCLVPAFGVCFIYYGATLDDAHITFRYARNFANGAGFGVWNVGERPVEGFTSFTWLMTASASLWLGLSPFITAKVVGAASLASMILLNILAWDAKRDDTRPLITAVLIAGYFPLAWYAVSGMEAVFFAALINALLLLPNLVSRRDARSAAAATLSILLVLTRPEGVVLALLINVFLLVYSPFSDDRNADLLPIVATVFAYAGMTVYRYLHFNALLPNAYYAKAAGGGWRHLGLGLDYLKEFAYATWPLWVLSSAGIATAIVKRRVTPFLSFTGGALAIYLCYIVKVGGDAEFAFPLWRHMVHIAPIWMCLVATAVAQLSPRKVVQVALVLGALLLSDGGIARHYRDVVITQPMRRLSNFSGLTLEPPDAYFTWVARLADSNTLSAASMAGKWGWYVPGNNIDVLGLNNYHVARFGTFADNGPVDSKTDMAWVMRQRPDIIDGYVSGSALRSGLCPPEMEGFRSVMIREMVTDPLFRSDYAFITNAPYDSTDRALFARRDYLQSHAVLTGAAAVSVGDTALYANGCATGP